MVEALLRENAELRHAVVQRDMDRKHAEEIGVREAELSRAVHNLRMKDTSAIVQVPHATSRVSVPSKGVVTATDVKLVAKGDDATTLDVDVEISHAVRE